MFVVKFKFVFKINFLCKYIFDQIKIHLVFSHMFYSNVNIPKYCVFTRIMKKMIDFQILGNKNFLSIKMFLVAKKQTRIHEILQIYYLIICPVLL